MGSQIPSWWTREFKIKGTSSAKPGSQAVSVTLNYRLVGTQNRTAVNLETGPYKWGEYVQNADPGMYEIKIVVRFREIASPSNTEGRSVEGQVTVRPRPDE